MHFRHLVSAIAIVLTVATASASTSPTVASVGDANSFGRNLHWLGLLDTEIDLQASCASLPAEPQNRCSPPAAAPTATSFNYLDLNRIVLPARSTHSLLCQWITPIISIQYSNPTSVPITANVNWTPSLTVESSVLADPSLIDLTTGAPFNGKLTASMSNSYSDAFTLAAGETRFVHNSFSQVCAAGAVNKQQLMSIYGLSTSQAQAIFDHDMTIRLNASGSIVGASSASFYFGLRFVGD